MVYNGKPYSNGWFGGTPIFGNIRLVHLHICFRCVWPYTFLTGHESKGWDAPIRYEWRNRSTGAHWNDHNVFEVGRSILEMKFLMRVQEKQQSPVLCEYWTSKWLTKHIQDLDFFGDWGQLSPREIPVISTSKTHCFFAEVARHPSSARGKKQLCCTAGLFASFWAMVPHWRNNLMILKTCKKQYIGVLRMYT